jgi:tripartite-type tricarboxylate transporter receptor subunit TctC
MTAQSILAPVVAAPKGWGGNMAVTTRRMLLAAPTILALAGRSAFAQGSWPDRPVRIVVSFTPGGTTDIIARLVANQLTDRWKQSVVIENRPGAGGNIGTEQVVRSPADGYTLLVGSVGPLAVNQSLYRNVSYNTLRDLAPITLLAGVPNILVLAPKHRFTKVDELVALARQQPGQISYGSTGVGTSAHLSGAMMAHMAKVEMVHVPYRGAVLLNDLLADRIDFSFATMPSVMEHVRAGRLKPLAVSSIRRSRATPEVPTMVECGFEGFDASSWFGMAAPAGTPPEIVRKIATDVAAILKQPDIEKQMVEQGADPVGNTPEEFASYIDQEIKRWREIVQITGATVD